MNLWKVMYGMEEEEEICDHVMRYKDEMLLHKFIIDMIDALAYH